MGARSRWSPTKNQHGSPTKSPAVSALHQAHYTANVCRRVGGFFLQPVPFIPCNTKLYAWGDLTSQCIVGILALSRLWRCCCSSNPFCTTHRVASRESLRRSAPSSAGRVWSDGVASGTCRTVEFGIRCPKRIGKDSTRRGRL